MLSKTIIWWQHNKGLLLLLLLLVVLRIPHFNRPLSKHHDFNNAVILINAVSWQQAGGGAAFAYTPLMNFQGESNKLLENGPHIDAEHNHVYLSFGAGWYVLPYFVFESLHMSPTPAALEILNILIGMLTTLLLYRLLLHWLQHKKSALLMTAFFTLMPAPLWYMGHSYVTTGIMLPLLLWILRLWQIASTKQLSLFQLLQLFTAFVLLLYIDWLPVFVGFSMAAWALWKSFRQPQYHAVWITCGLAVATGICLVFTQFASYLGWEQVWQYWQSRSAERSMGTAGNTTIQLVLQAGKHLLSGYFPLFIVAAIIGIKKLPSSTTSVLKHWSTWALCAVLLYNLLLFNWSALHEFAWMAFGLVFCLWLFLHYGEALLSTAATWVRAVMVVSLLAFYIINLPGPKNIRGEPYNAQQTIASRIQQKIPADAIILSNHQAPKIIEWYSKRTFNFAANEQAAQSIANSKSATVYWALFNGEELLLIKQLTVRSATAN